MSDLETTGASLAPPLVRTDRGAVIGDIHGSADQLERLLEKLAGRDLFVTGDLCDRGPDTKRVMELLIARGARGVLGNHDLWFREWAMGRGFDRFALSAIMGGTATLASYGVRATSTFEIEAARSNVPSEHVRFLSTLEPILNLEVAGAQFVLVHAGIPPLPDVLSRRPEERLAYMQRTRPTDLLWKSTHPSRVPEVGRTLIMGHVPLLEPLDLGAVIAVDTGCGTCHPNLLSAVLLPEREFLSEG